MLDEPPPVVGGVACQTIESFLLAKYMRNGVPPKPGMLVHFHVVVKFMRRGL